MTICKFEGCEKPHQAHGYCGGHALQLRQGRELRPLRRRAPNQRKSNAETKQCGNCKLVKPLNEFNTHKSGKYEGFHYSYCFVCSRLQSKKGYITHKTRYDIRNAEKRGVQRDLLRELIWKHFETHPCVDCGNNDPMVLHFDHVDRTTKKYSISRIVNNGYSVKTVFDEIAKCVVRCANCHQKRTAKQMGWWSTKNVEVLE